MWINNQVQWVEQGVTYRTNERICLSQMVWIMKTLAHVSLIMIGAQIICRRRYDGIGPNGLAFSYYVLIATFSIFLLNYYMKSDWRAYWNGTGIDVFSNAIRHEAIAYHSVFLFVIQFTSFLDYFYQLYSKTWSFW